MSDQKQKITAAFNDSTVGMHEPVSPIMLALVLRQIMPSLNIAQVDEMATAHMLEKDKSKETTFSDFLEWLFSEDHIKILQPVMKAGAHKAEAAAAPAKAAAPSGADVATMPEEAAKSWSTFQELLKTRPYLADPSTGHPLCSFVEQCNQSFSEKKFEETAILVERITSTITEDEKRITAAFKHFDKDGSGVLEHQEFKFLCAYLGWSSEESNSIDVNKDGTVSLSELQTFVGYLGGVQKFFEQRRKRVTQSRKDVKDVCPIVGVEVGARVRAHFYYENGQKSKSWREAQVLSVNCHTDSGRGILLEFGFEDVKGSSDWVARQVVPTSWILSSQEETSLAAALREVGILDDSQALYKMLFPMSELQSIQALVSCQRAALSLVRQQASLSHEAALVELNSRFQQMGYGDYELQAVFSWVKDLAPLVVHVHLDNMGQFLESDEYYRNQFETKTSCGALDPENNTRTDWERTLFGDSYDKAKPFDRCKYGALNVTNDYRGVTSAMQYGDSYLVLKDVRLRATFCATDSGGIEGSRLGCCDRYAHVLQEYNEDELQEIIRVAMAALPQQEKGTPAGNVPKSAWPQVLRADSEDCSQEWITVGYPNLAKRSTGRFVYEVEFYEEIETPQVGVLSELYERCLGVKSPTGVGDDQHGWSLDAEHAELWFSGQSRGWEGCRLAGCNGGKQFVGVAVDLAEKKLWFGVNGVWNQTPAFLNLPEGIALYPALSFKGRGSFVFHELRHPPPKAMGEFSPWPKTYQGKYRIDCPRVGNSDILSVYKEFQVHGEVCLKKHVCRLVANNKYRETPKFERSRNVELSKGGPYNGTYEKVGVYNNAPLYHCEDVSGWIFHHKESGTWRMRTDSGEKKCAVGNLITAQRNEKTQQAGIISKILPDNKFEISWADGDETDKIKSKDDLELMDNASSFVDDGSFLLEAPADLLLGDAAPPVSGWMAAPESSGYLDLDFFKFGMKKLGYELEGAELKKWTDQLLKKTSKGKEVIMRRPTVDVSFDKIFKELGSTEDGASAWKKIGEAAQQAYLVSQGFDERCRLIQTEHPYKAERHSWTKDICLPDAKGCKFVFSKKCQTFDSCAKFMIKTGGIAKSTIGPGMRVEVDGKDGLRRFGTVVEVDADKGGKLIKLIPEDKENPSEEFAFVIEGDFEKKRVDYYVPKSLPGDEIEGFQLIKSQPMAPVGITGFKSEKAAHSEGVKEWHRLDIVETMMGWTQDIYDQIGGDGLTKEPMQAEDVLQDLEAAVKTLNNALAKTDWEEGAAQISFYFFNGCSHRIVPEAHIHFKGRVSDEIKGFEVAEGNPKIDDLGPGLAYTAGVRRGWVLSVEDTLSEENTGIHPSLSEVEMRCNPEKILELENVTLVFECEEPEQSCQAEMYADTFYNYEADTDVVSVEFETDGDGSSSPERRWGVLCLVVPKDFEPKGGKKWRWYTSDEIGIELKDLGIRKEANASAAVSGGLKPSPSPVKVINEMEVDGWTWLQLDEDSWVPCYQEDEDGSRWMVLEKIEPWDEVMAQASDVMVHAEGVADANPLVSREGWDEERLRALCMRHGWEFEWMSEDGERRRRGAERQGLVVLPAATTKSDTHCPDGFETKKSS